MNTQERAIEFVRDRYPFDEDTQQFWDMVVRVSQELAGEEAAERAARTAVAVVTPLVVPAAPVVLTVLAVATVVGALWWRNRR